MDELAGMGDPCPGKSQAWRGIWRAGSKKFQKGPRNCGWAEVLHPLGADSKCLFCGVNRLVEDRIRGRLLRSPASLGAWTGAGASASAGPAWACWP